MADPVQKLIQFPDLTVAETDLLLSALSIFSARITEGKTDALNRMRALRGIVSREEMRGEIAALFRRINEAKGRT